jgi:cellulose synthase/poly-beta-1,6-N-acetylglucosamine synthase-like glycosyltransferase
MDILFWLNFNILIYIYIGYPILIKILAANKNLYTHKEDYFPTVSILIAAYNEEKHISDTLINKIGLDYPKEKLEIIVVSDASEDKTDKIVEKISAESDINVSLIRQEPRAGKTSGLNLIVTKAKGEIIIFSDANSMYVKDALINLVRNFADNNIGYVTGKMVYTSKDGSLIGDGCGTYMKFENWLRQQETLVGSIVGVDGGIDAMRKSLYETLRADQLPDFVQALKVVDKGYRVIYEPKALLSEEALDDCGQEYKMRVRVTLRALWALQDMRHLLNPAKYLLFSFKLISHKLFRYLAFIPIFVCFISNILLTSEGITYILFLFSQCLFYFLAWQGRQHNNDKNTPFYYTFPYYFCLINMASAHATWRYLKRERQATWNSRSG